MTKTQADLHGEIDTQLPTNHTHAIPAGSARTVLHDIVDNFQVSPGRINTIGGTPDGSTYLAGDGTWKSFVAVAGGGGVSSANFVSTLDIAKTTSFPAVGSGGPQWIVTQGYHSVGDYGGALYERISSLPAAPLANIGTWTSADGAHWIMRPNGDEPWASAFGASPRAYNDTTFDNWQPFEDCKYWILSNSAAMTPIGGSSFTMRFPRGFFYLSKAHSIEGGQYNIRGSGRGSILRTPLREDTIQIQHAFGANQTIGHEGTPYNTAFPAAVGVHYYWAGGTKVFNCTVGGVAAGTEPAGTGTGIVSGAATFDYVRPLTWSETRGQGAGFAKISDLTLFGNWSRGDPASTDDEDMSLSNGAYHSGILMRSRAQIDNVSTFAYPGFGIAIISSGDKYLRSTGNVNDWRLNRIQSYYHGHQGIHIGYGDANAGLATDIDVSSNAEIGIGDSSFLTNTWVGVQSAYDGVFVGGGLARYFGMVEHHGYLWLARVPVIGVDSAANYHNEPGTDPNSWVRWSGDGTVIADGLHNTAWNSTDTYRPTASFLTEDINNRATWQGVYIESGTAPAQWAPRTVVWGGLLLSNFDGTKGAPIFNDGGVNSGLRMDASFSSGAGNQFFNTTFGNQTRDGGMADFVEANIIKHQNAEGSDWSLIGLAPGGAIITGSVADVTLSGNVIPVLTVTAVTGGATGVFGPGNRVSGGSLPAHLYIARQINPSTGATITFVGGVGSYALSKRGITQASTTLAIDNNGMNNLDYAIQPTGARQPFGWTGPKTTVKGGRNTTQPHTPVVPGLLLGTGDGLGNPGNARLIGYATGVPSAGDYGHIELRINSNASASGDPVLVVYCKTGPHAGTWQTIAVMP